MRIVQIAMRDWFRSLPKKLLLGPLLVVTLFVSGLFGKVADLVDLLVWIKPYLESPWGRLALLIFSAIAVMYWMHRQWMRDLQSAQALVQAVEERVSRYLSIVGNYLAKTDAILRIETGLRHLEEQADAYLTNISQWPKDAEPRQFMTADLYRFWHQELDNLRDFCNASGIDAGAGFERPPSHEIDRESPFEFEDKMRTADALREYRIFRLRRDSLRRTVESLLTHLKGEALQLRRQLAEAKRA